MDFTKDPNQVVQLYCAYLPKDGAIGWLIFECSDIGYVNGEWRYNVLPGSGLMVVQRMENYAMEVERMANPVKYLNSCVAFEFDTVLEEFSKAAKQYPQIRIPDQFELRYKIIHHLFDVYDQHKDELV